MTNAAALTDFFDECCENRSVASTRMNDRSSRSHAIYTVVVHRTTVDVSEDGGKVGFGFGFGFVGIDRVTKRHLLHRGLPDMHGNRLWGVEHVDADLDPSRYQHPRVRA